MMNKKNNETTLTHLTKRFVKLLNANSERVVNLNEASTRLSVAKRRIYDITNVLEGIGLLQKTSKNVTRWVDCPRDSPFAAPPSANLNNHQIHLMTTTPNGTATATNIVSSNHNIANGNPHNHPLHNNNANQLAASDPIAELKSIAGLNLNLNSIPDAELLGLLKTYQKLEEGVNDLEANIRQQLNADGAYVTYHDIKSSFNDQTVIAVKAPPETRLEVNENLQIHIKSEHGQIEVYLYQHNNNSTTNNNGQSNTTHQQLQNVYQTQQTASSHHHLQQQSQTNSNNPNNTNAPPQPLDATFTNTNNLIGQQQTTTQSNNYNSISSDEGRGRSTMSTTDGGIYYDPTSGVSETDNYYNDPTLSSALSGTISEDEDPFKPLVPFEAREEPHYNFVLDENYTITSLFPEDNLGLY